MQESIRASPMRRRILQAGVALSASAVAWLGCVGAAANAAEPLTPTCDDGDDPTPSQTAGPFYTPNSPERSALIEPGITGVPIVLAGLVPTRDCRPVADALFDCDPELAVDPA